MSRPPVALRIALVPSPRLAALVVGLHGAAAACALAVLPGALGALGGIALAAAGVSAAWRTALLRSRRAVRALDVRGERLELTLASGERYPAQAAARRYVGRWLVTLPLSYTARRRVRRTVLVTRDMLGDDAFRRLRIWALWGRVPAVAPKQLSG